MKIWRIVVWKSRKNDQWYCRALHGNSRVVWQTEGYMRKGGALHAANKLASVIEGCVVEVRDVR